jgi:hypothetical protein
MQREIKLDGGEISILKTLGLSGVQVPGKVLIERSHEMETAELLDTLNGLISMDYVQANKFNLRTLEDIEKTSFRVNSAYAHELRDAVHPSRHRDQERTRRKRRG